MAALNYLQRLAESAQKEKSVLCMGLDPVLEDIPIKEKDAEKKIVKFYSTLLKAARSSKAKMSAVKPNYAFFAQYGFPGLRALKKVVEMYKKHYIVLLDAKRGDIGKTSEAYAKEVFDFWQADAVTINPFLGFDTVSPYFEHCKKGKGVYILVRTSNPGAAEFQNLTLQGKPLYKHVAERLLAQNIEGAGAVVGATAPQELDSLIALFNTRRIPLLIPGIGTQGGFATEIGRNLQNSKNIQLHRVSASSSITYAYKKENTKDYADAAVKAIEKINRELNLRF
ncbi:orotidine-5'-phosphate decarboxylase [Candidatus Woesearchaeota archaeon]|nr:orotidine-5'-phosphate decarboxylase [Candidatus Woesearchaeota archaeon]